MARAVTGRRAVVIGASGYIGTHLVPRLLAEGWSVRATARDPEVLAGRGWDAAELVAADVLEPETLAAACEGMDVVFYLVHCMAAGGDFQTLERLGAEHLVAAADAGGVERIVYLGGLMPEGPTSQHLRARRETGEILREAKATVVEVRAGMIVGPGSAAWEVMRDLVNHLPVMVTPRWVRSRSTPIALENLLVYLLGFATVPIEARAILEVGGGDVCSYEEMMNAFGDLQGRRRPIIPVPVLTPRLSSYWLWLVTSVPTNLARALIEGLAHDLVADDARARELVPQHLMTFEETARAALDAEQRIGVQGRWVEGSMLHRRWNPRYSFYSMRSGAYADTSASVEALWRVVLTVGRDGDFFFGRWLWRLRRVADWLLVGPALRRRRRDPEDLRLGDVVDAFHVVRLEPRQRLTLQLEMRAPGAGMLEFRVQPLEHGARVWATAWWHPKGVWGLLYWYALLPFHDALFRGIAKEIVRRAESDAPAPRPA
jgi:uncharacterized protein YbjT (DUF2867 family)